MLKLYKQKLPLMKKRYYIHNIIEDAVEEDVVLVMAGAEDEQVA